MAEDGKRKDPPATFRTGEMNTMQAQRRLPLSAAACSHRYQANTVVRHRVPPPRRRVASSSTNARGGKQASVASSSQGTQSNLQSCRRGPAAPFHRLWSLQAPAEALAGPSCHPSAETVVWGGEQGPQGALGCTPCWKRMNGSSLLDRGLLSYSPGKSPH